MKERYRNMMEQAVLSEQAKAAFEQKLDNAHPTKKGVRVLRTALIAACVCLALVGGAFAATYIAGFSAFETYEAGNLIFKNVGRIAYSGYRLSGGMAPIPAQEFSDEVRALPEGNTQVIFDSWEEAERFLGVQLERNTLLEEMEHTLCIDPKLERNAHCVLGFSVGDNGLEQVFAEAHYVEGENHILSSVLVSWYALLTTENSDRTHAYEVLYPSERELLVEKYTGVGGLESIIVEARKPEGDSIWTVAGPGYREANYRGYFSVNGVAYCVGTWGYCAIECEESDILSLKLLKQIIDSYVVS